MLKKLKLILMVLWQAPQNIVALVMYPFLGKKEIIKKENNVNVYKAEKMRGGISLGNFVYISEYSSTRKETVAHELGHCKQSRLLGWLYLLIIGIPSICWAAFKPKKKCYYSFYTEKWANKNAGLEVRKGKYGCYTYFPKSKKEVITEKSHGVHSRSKSQGVETMENKKEEKTKIEEAKKPDISLKDKIDMLNAHSKNESKKDISKLINTISKNGTK